ncbi:MAG TPA: 2-(1,2-epoxy-1,2-dihydrophenyl)acetyl-CoA isomerase PaaG [Terriglobales bacterium]|nr:2-(1,2-epoxy-1,2-dihydrophenyl)acetyl-CoA isomerase PaaG [Terriglobales bacterium]
MPAHENIRFDLKDGVARLTLHRPDKLNSFNLAMHMEVRHAIAATAEARARVLLLTGAGRGFCAGQDLGDRAMQASGGVPDLGASIEKFYSPLIKSLRSLEMPVVCAVNGVAAGAGANLALACDIVIAAESAFFYEPFCKLGLVPDTGGTYVLPRRAGVARALGMALLGERVSARQAAEWGMIWRAVPDAEFPEAVEAIVQQLATGPTLGLAATKAAIYSGLTNSLHTQLDIERDLNRALGHSRDYAEGVAAFLAKRTPNFEGR